MGYYEDLRQVAEASRNHEFPLEPLRKQSRLVYRQAGVLKGSLLV